MTINDCIDIIKENSELGILYKMNNIILKIWFYYHLYFQKDFILFEKDYPKKSAFLLFNLSNSEIVIIAVSPKYQKMGFGSNLISLLPPYKIHVIHEEETINFYKKNGFKWRKKINTKQYLSIKF